MKKEKQKNNGKRNKPGLKTETKKGILAIALFAAAIVSTLSYFDLAGIFGKFFLKFGALFFGNGYFLITLALVMGGAAVYKSLHEDLYWSTIAGLILFLLSFLGALEIFSRDAGGYLGKIIGAPLIKIFDFWASLIILVVFFIISIIITFNVSLKKLLKIGKTIAEAEGDNKVDAFKQETDPETFIQKGKGFLAKPNFQIKKVSDDIEIKEEKEQVGKGDESMVIADSKIKSNFRLPPVDLLEEDKGEPSSGDIQANASIIKRTLQNFGIEVDMAEVNVGPTVTQYTLRPAQGIKLTKITALSNDLALALAAHPIRIEAPIPGRSLVGVELPNKIVAKVRMRNLVAHPIIREKKSSLVITAGRNVAGMPVFPDLSKMPHLLIAGATGTGKTICLNSLIVSLLYQNTPETLRLILIDPKRVEFIPYMGIPHLLTPVILNPEKAINALKWCVGEMERRFDLLSEMGARDISSYNQKMKQRKEPELLPYLVIVIDELADLMAAHGRDIEAGIIRIAQMARAVGIHLVLATQRPSVEVITGLIKANITSRVSFQVASQIDSRTILDSAGAEKLLGNGDMLFLSAESSKPRRLQGVYISEKEVKAVANFLKEGGEASYQEEVVQPHKDQLGFDLAGDDGADDELYGEAKKLVVESGKASASLMQRRLRVGYARAARLLDLLEERGIVGPADGAKPREILIDRGE